MNKVKAFTITEVLITMAISVILVGIAFSVVSLLNKNIVIIQNNYSQADSQRLLEQRILLDFNKYAYKTYNASSETLTLRSPIDSVQYQFSEKGIVRVSDTLYQDKTNTKFFFLGKEVTQGAIDAIKLEFLVQENSTENKNLFIFTKNDVQTRMSYNGN